MGQGMVRARSYERGCVRYIGQYRRMRIGRRTRWCVEQAGIEDERGGMGVHRYTLELIRVVRLLLQKRSRGWESGC